MRISDWRSDVCSSDLAGSGKTIVLALKAAYLHTQYPNWRIAVTFHTRARKGQFRRLINHLCIEQSGEEPDWTKIRGINAWGAPISEARRVGKECVRKCRSRW